MLIRLILLVAIVVGGIFFARKAVAAARERKLRLSDGQLAELQALAHRHPAIAEGLDARARLLSIDGIHSVPSVVYDVDGAMKELLHHATLVDRMNASIGELWNERVEQSYTKYTKSAAKDAVKQAELATLERQRETAERLRARKDTLENDMRVLSLGLRDLYVSVLELSASQGGLKKGDTKGAGLNLRNSSDEVRRRAEAYDEVEAFVVESTQ
jgi:hypothetical protein